MPLPAALARLNRRVTNPLLRNLVGIGPFAELEHVGRRSGLARHTVLLAFRDGSTVTVALTYGPDVDWLKNIEAAGGARMRLRGRVLDLGPATRLTPAAVRRQIPGAVRSAVALIDVHDFIELPVLADRPDHR